VVDGLEAMGLRGVVAFGPEDTDASSSAPRDPAVVRACLDEHEALADRSATSERVGFRLGIGTLLGQTDELLAASITAAREHGWGGHTHLAEVRSELMWAERRWGHTTVAHAAAVGLLDLSLLAAHCVWVHDGDVDLLAAAGVTVVHNPVANMLLGSGVCPVGMLRRAGIPVGLGTDGAASNDSQNMLEVVKTAPLLQKVTSLDPRTLSAGDALAMATIEGARALGLQDVIGSLEPGKRADLVRLRGDRPALASVHNPRQQVVYGATAGDVGDVWVDGHRRVTDGELVGHDLAALVGASRPLAAELVTKAGLAGFSQLAR
jgi:cytosine/adenosine deaminase-related metal-dependent hydrolase